MVEEAGPHLLVELEEGGVIDPIRQLKGRRLDHRHSSDRRVATTTASFPPGFFDRVDDGDDAVFYAPPRLVTHIDDDAVAAVGELYEELGISGDVLDLMSSWVSHFRVPPRKLRVLGMNTVELEANAMAAECIIHDLNADPRIPLSDASVDDAVCCVSVDYLTQPVEVFRDVARVLRPGGRFVCTFSNRLFPTKAIRGRLYASDDDHCRIVDDMAAPIDDVSGADDDRISGKAGGEEESEEEDAFHRHSLAKEGRILRSLNPKRLLARYDLRMKGES